MTTTRFAGVANIVRFNRGKYFGALLVVLGLTFAAVNGTYRTLALLSIAAIVLGIAVSLGVSYWVYDRSDLYEIRWADAIKPDDDVAVVHAGLDEVSSLLRPRLSSDPHVVSFYDRIAVAEPSIRRAQGELPTDATVGRPLVDSGAFDWIVAFMCLHELRVESARRDLLAELRDGLDEDGHIVLVEHLRDLPNALAFTVGVTHFLSRRSWMADFEASGLRIVSERKMTLFVTEFVLARS